MSFYWPEETVAQLKFTLLPTALQSILHNSVTILQRKGLLNNRSLLITDLSQISVCCQWIFLFLNVESSLWRSFRQNGLFFYSLVSNFRWIAFINDMIFQAKAISLTGFYTFTPEIVIGCISIYFHHNELSPWRTFLEVFREMSENLTGINLLQWTHAADLH